MSHLETRTLKVAILASGEPIFAENCITVEIVDEAAGEYVEIEQDGSKIHVSPEEWPMLRSALDQMIGSCRANGKAVQP